MRALIAASLLGPLLAIPALAQAPAPPQTTQPAAQTAELRTAAELARICAADANTINTQYYEYGYCFGFTSGALQYHQATTAPNAPKLYCAPTPPPSFEVLRGRYVAWVNASAANGAMRPVESIFAFLRAEFPCPTPPPPRTRRR